MSKLIMLSQFLSFYWFSQNSFIFWWNCKLNILPIKNRTIKGFWAALETIGAISTLLMTWFSFFYVDRNTFELLFDISSIKLQYKWSKNEVRWDHEITLDDRKFNYYGTMEFPLKVRKLLVRLFLEIYVLNSNLSINSCKNL